MARSKRASLVAGAVSALVFLAACGGSEYRYVTNTEEGTYFRVPAEWELFRVRAEEPIDRIAAPAGEAPWRVVFDSAEQPALEHIDENSPVAPVGQSLVIPIDLQQGDQLSAADLRQALIGLDPLQGGDGVEVVDFQQLLTDSGLRGTRVLFNRQLGDGSWVTVDHSSLMNAEGTKVYVFEVRCEATCFKEQRQALAQIVDSWGIKD